MSDHLAEVPRLGTQERELLLLCARTTFSDPEAYRVDELLGQQLEWDALVWHARLHSVAPLLHNHLRGRRAYGDLPRGARRQLLALYHRTAYQNDRFAREGRVLIETFRAAGIEVIVAKGIALLELAYGHFALRPLIDLDFLIPSGKVQQSTSQLRELGYVREPMALVEGVYRWTCPQWVFTASRDIAVSVLVRCDLINWPRAHRFSPAGLWARAEPARVCGAEAMALSPVDLVLYLCAQADNQGYFNRVGLDHMRAADLLFAPWTNNRLIRFTDISEVIRQYAERIDWSLLVERARESELQEAVYVSLSLANSLLGPAAPPDVLEQLRSRPRHRLRGWIFDGVAHQAQHQGSASIGKRLAGSIWIRGSEARLMWLARLLAFVELTFPDRRTLSILRGSRCQAGLLPAYSRHVASAVGRAVAGYLARCAERALHPLARLAARPRMASGKRAASS
ncbi:MAG: nucleotidyltransferase family protein [Actinomycetota bacterium]